MTPRAIRVLVTRPAAEAQRWTEALRAHGIEAESLPLIEIAPLADTSSLQAAWQTVSEQKALMFVSANAVRHFPFHAAALAQAGLRAWGTGPGTSVGMSGRVGLHWRVSLGA